MLIFLRFGYDKLLGKMVTFLETGKNDNKMEFHQRKQQIYDYYFPTVTVVFAT